MLSTLFQAASILLETVLHHKPTLNDLKVFLLPYVEINTAMNVVVKRDEQCTERY